MGGGKRTKNKRGKNSNRNLTPEKDSESKTKLFASREPDASQKEVDANFSTADASNTEFSIASANSRPSTRGATSSQSKPTETSSVRTPHNHSETRNAFGRGCGSFYSTSKPVSMGVDDYDAKSRSNNPKHSGTEQAVNSNVQKSTRDSRYDNRNQGYNNEDVRLKSSNVPRYSESNRRSRSSSRSGGLSYTFWWEIRDKGCKEDGNIKESFGDLFMVSKEYSLGHCVAEDMNMGSGIATSFRRDFKRVDELLDQRATQGGLAVLHIENRYIYYLVTKRYSNGKPTYDTLFRSLVKMQQHMIENNVKKLALPRIGCGLDGLEWSYVKSMLKYIFEGVDVEIVVYNFQQTSDTPTPQSSMVKCKLVNRIHEVISIEAETIILYPCSQQKSTTDAMKSLDGKFRVLTDYDRSSREMGTVIRTDPHGKKYIVYGVVVRENEDAAISHVAFRKCIREIDKQNRHDRYKYVAMEGFVDVCDELAVSKLINLMRNGFHRVEVYVCWPKDLARFAPIDAEFGPAN